MNVRLKSALLATGKRQFEIAAELGWSETKLSRIVQGRAAADKDEQKALARYLKAKEAELFDA